MSLLDLASFLCPTDRTIGFVADIYSYVSFQESLDPFIFSPYIYTFMFIYLRFNMYFFTSSITSRLVSLNIPIQYKLQSILPWFVQSTLCTVLCCKFCSYQTSKIEFPIVTKSLTSPPHLITNSPDLKRTYSTVRGREVKWHTGLGKHQLLSMNILRELCIIFKVHFRFSTNV